MIHTAACVVFVVALAGPASAAPRPKPPKVPRLAVSLIVSPQGVGRAPWTVDVRVRAYDPLRELSCPSYHFDCGLAGQWFHLLGDCQDPFANPEDRPELYRSAATSCRYLEAGEYVIRGFITDARHGRGQMASALMATARVLVTGRRPAALGP